MENKSSLIKKLLIVFALIFLILFCISQKNASALVAKNLTYQPNAISSGYKTGSYEFSNGTTQHWFNIPLQNPYTKNNNYDLIAFRFDALNYYSKATASGDSWIDGSIDTNYTSNNVDLTIELPNQTDHSVTVTGVIWDNLNTARLCYFASDTPSYLFCPLEKNATVSRIGLYVTANYENPTTIKFNYEINNSFYFYNYESTEIVNSNGVIVQQQQQTQQTIINSDTSGAGTGAISDFTTGSTGLNTDLDNAVGVNSFTTIFTNFFTQIENSTCTPLSLPIPYTNENLVLPCLGTEFQNRIPVLWTLYVTIITGVIVLKFWRHYIDMFKHLLDPYSTGLHDVGDIAGGGK